MSKFTQWVKRNSPELLLASAILTAVTAVVSGCVATAKVNKRIIEPSKPKAIELHNKVNELSKDPNTPKELLSSAKKERNIYYLKTGGKIALYYAPAFLALTFSIASMVGSHNIMRGRNIALSAAFTAMKTSYDAYRDRVREKFGEEAEKALAVDCNKKKVVTKNEKGKEVTKEINVPKDGNTNVYNEYWGPGNGAYNPNLGKRANLTTLYQIEQYLNDNLRIEGVVFLSEVYKHLGFTPQMLGLTKYQASRTVGWKFDPSDKNIDSRIDFGLRDTDGNESQAVRDFLADREEYILLNFNYDGNIVTDDKEAQKAFDAICKKGW